MAFFRTDDHNLRCGDSLVGLTQKQIEAFTWEEKTAGKQRILGQDFLEKRIKAATAYRRDILEGGDYVLPSLKAAKLKLADEALDEVRFAGDLIISAFFATDKDKARSQKLEELRERYVACHTGKTFDPTLKPREAVHQLRNGEKAVWPFHWHIEFPEVFGRASGGFDAIVGNPPFLGGTRISSSTNGQYRDWILNYSLESHGNADLVAHFFRQAFRLIRNERNIGLIATNTIGQGDTRATGLRWICVNGGTIYAARKRQKWPGQAAVMISVVWINKGSEQKPPFDLDGHPVKQITAYLFHAGGHETPKVLLANDGRSFIGCKPYGKGFIFDDGDPECHSLHLMDQLKRDGNRNSEVIFPYLGGEDVNDFPDHKTNRYIINFGERSEMEARKWPDLLSLVERTVKPARAHLTTNAIGRRRASLWWQFGSSASELNAAIASYKRVLVCSQTSKYRTFAFVPPNQVFDQKLVVLAAESFEEFSVLSSRIHECWALFFGSSLEDRPVYTPTDCFETYAFPSVLIGNELLRVVGDQLYGFRAGLMARNSEGLTKTYNRFHDPDETSSDILKLRELHASMDRAVLDAYGWADIATDCEFLLEYEDDEDEDAESKGRKRKKPWRYRWPDAVRDEVLARLLKLNAERAEQERLAGEAASPFKPVKKAATGAKRGRKPKAEPVVAAAPARQLPTDLRLAENVPGLYAVGLVVALLSEAGGTLLASQLIDVFALATQPDQMKRMAPPEYEKAAEEWATVWNEQATPHDLLPALDNLTSANIAVERTTLGIEFSLQDGPKSKLPPHLAYDAWLALRVAETLEPSVALVTGADRDAFTAKLELLTA